MKKIFTMILVAAGLLSVNAASAQYRNDRNNNQGSYPVYQQNDNWNNNQGQQSRDYGSNNRRGRNNDYERQRQYEYERQRQAELDRMNRDYDRRIEGYRNDRRMSRYERERQIQQAEYERQQKAKSFGKGMVVGGIAAIVLGVLIGSAGH
jgi:hypothetical protein